MKKHLLAGMLLSLLLAGCTQRTLRENTQGRDRYIINHDTAPQYLAEAGYSNGSSLTCFPLDTAACSLYSISDDLLIVYPSPEGTMLQTYSGADLRPMAQACIPHPESEWHLMVTPVGLQLYDFKDNRLLLLDEYLQVCSDLTMPEGIQGIPILADSGRTVYFCGADAIFSLDTGSGIQRILRQTGSQSMSMKGAYRGGEVLEITVAAETESQHFFLRSYDGAVIYSTCEAVSVFAGQTAVCAGFLLGNTPCVLCSTENGKASLLPLTEGGDILGFLYRQNRILVFRSQDSALVCYDPDTGQKTAGLTLPPDGMPGNPIEIGKLVFFTMKMNGAPYLCRWEPEQDPPETPAFLPVCAAPDPDGFQQCLQTAQELSGELGIRILIGEDAAAQLQQTQPVIPEDLVPVVESELHKLPGLFGALPEEFLTQLQKSCGNITLCIVRQAKHPSEPAGSFLYRTDTGSFIVLEAGPDSQGTLLHMLCHLIDTHVFTRCNAYDSWEMLNPAGFSYTGGDQESPGSDVYLRKEAPAFIDAFAMAYPREDRARILEYASLPGNAHYFRSPVLQAKLQRICSGIRTAFHLTAYSDPLPWEQYLWQ